MTLLATLRTHLRAAWIGLRYGPMGLQATVPQEDWPSLSPQDLADAQAFFPRPKFFIYGHARSGTTLLTRLVRVHPQVHCNYQGHFFTRRPFLRALTAHPDVREWLARRSNRWNQGRDLAPLVLRVSADFIMEREARQLGKSIVGDKSPNSLVDEAGVRALNAIYPDARLIFIVRDGRDVLISHRIQSFIDSPQKLSPRALEIRRQFAENPQDFFAHRKSLFTAREVRHAARAWAHNITATHAVAQSLLGERYLSLRYEDLLSQPWENMRRIWDFLGADTALPELPTLLDAEMNRNPDADWQKQKADAIAANLSKGKRGSWRELFTPRDIQIFKEEAGQMLIAWQYEDSLDW